jgi:c-di-GMP-binding flagellar brake protein YcgR
MPFKSLVVCAEHDAAEILRRVLKELEIDAEFVDLASASHFLADDRFDILIVDCENRAVALDLLKKARSLYAASSCLTVAILQPGEDVKQLFALGTNFILYKPVSLERTRTSLQSARSLVRHERRGADRVPLNTPTGVACAGAENIPAIMRDLSESGTSIECSKDLPRDARVYFQFILPGHNDPVRLSGEVVWQDSRGRVGLRFSEVPQVSARLLKTWLRQNVFRKERTQNAARKPEALANAAAASGDDALARLLASPGNRREQSRHACRLGAEIYLEASTVPHRCELSDLSTGGCYVEMPTPLSAGMKVEIVVRTRDLKISTKGVVQAVHPGFGMGVSFEPRTQKERDEIEQLISLLHSQQRLDPVR